MLREIMGQLRHSKVPLTESKTPNTARKGFLQYSDADTIKKYQR